MTCAAVLGQPDGGIQQNRVKQQQCAATPEVATIRRAQHRNQSAPHRQYDAADAAGDQVGECRPGKHTQAFRHATRKRNRCAPKQDRHQTQDGRNGGRRQQSFTCHGVTDRQSHMLLPVKSYQQPPLVY